MCMCNENEYEYGYYARYLALNALSTTEVSAALQEVEKLW